MEKLTAEEKIRLIPELLIVINDFEVGINYTDGIKDEKLKDRQKTSDKALDKLNEIIDSFEV